MPLFDPPRHDSAETIKRALNLGVNVKMITGMYVFLSFFSFLLSHFSVDCVLVCNWFSNFKERAKTSPCDEICQLMI